MSEKDLGESATSENNLTKSDHILLRDYSNLLNRRISLAALLLKKKNIAAKIEKEGVSGPDNELNMQFAQSVINDLRNQDSDLAHQEQVLIDKMSEEGKKEACEIRASVASYLL